LRLLRRPPGADFIEHELEATLADSGLSSVDRHLCQELVFGVIRHQSALDWLIERKTPGRTQKPALRDLLRLGLYQIFYLDRIPNHAAVHETVELAKRNGFGPQAGFVNALLRGYIREIDATRELLRELKKTHPAIGYSHPEWLVTRWQSRWGADRAGELMEWNNSRPKTCARVNTLKIDAEKLLPQWRDENVEYDFVRKDWFPDNTVFELKGHPPLTWLESFKQGFFYVQDPSTLLAPREVAARPGEEILDLCAAPGGKLSSIAEQMRNEGRIFAHDIAVDRLKLVAENCARLGIKIVTSITPAELQAQTTKQYDRILLDVPCSNTGTMRRRVDLRWRIRPEEIGRLRRTQLELLRQAAQRLKKGGTLVYSTCSLEADENREVALEFQREHPTFKLEHDRELLPFVDGVDGAYVATFTKGG
jgi:16S rRNA (cytosine967-C5)-methyltransferase